MKILIRSYNTNFEVADGRTITGRCVPFGLVAEVSDGGVPYRESFQAGAFARATRAPQRVELRYEHGVDLLSVAGVGVELEERSDGLWGSFRAFTTAVGDQALALVAAQILTGLSVGFRPLGPGRRAPDGSVVRTACHLEEVSLCRAPVHMGAELTVRSHLDAPERNAQLDDRLRALGLTT